MDQEKSEGNEAADANDEGGEVTEKDKTPDTTEEETIPKDDVGDKVDNDFMDKVSGDDDKANDGEEETAEEEKKEEEKSGEEAGRCSR